MFPTLIYSNKEELMREMQFKCAIFNIFHLTQQNKSPYQYHRVTLLPFFQT